MFSKLFQDDSEAAQKERAKLAFEKISSLKKEAGRDARSARIRMVLLCRAHLDKSFVEGAEKTAAHEELVMQAIVGGYEKPPAPQAAEYQQVSSVSGEKVWVYLPMEYAEIAFALGGSYQRTDLTAEQAIDAMQGLANQIFSLELGIDDPFLVLQFLRDEIGAPPTADAAGTDAPNV
ncbi:MAG: hypothetical protein RLZ63_78 [Pseudomonadota bacterium]|jgi:hypothetical protein